MVIAFSVILFIIGCCMSSYEDYAYKVQKREERLEKELMRILEENRNSAPPAPRRRKQVRRRFAQDKNGNILGEEILEEELED